MTADVFTRWAIVHAHDGSPIEGALYVHKDKANRRLGGLPNPRKFAVIEVAVLPAVLVRDMIAALQMAAQERKNPC